MGLRGKRAGHAARSQLSGRFPLASSSRAALMAMEMSLLLYVVPPQLVLDGTSRFCTSLAGAAKTALTAAARRAVAKNRMMKKGWGGEERWGRQVGMVGEDGTEEQEARR